MAGENAAGVALLSSWTSPFAQRVRVALAEKGIDYELVEEDLLLCSSNPVHKKVPVLIHDGKHICDSLVILEYADEAFPDTPPLLPADPYERALARFWASYVDKKLVDCGSRLLNREGDPQMQARAEMVEIFKTLEGELGEKDFFGGEHGFGFVDAVLAPFTSSFLSYERYGGFKLAEVAPGMAAWWKRAEDTESVLKSWL